MNQEKNRLLSLIEYVQESAKLKRCPIYHVNNHPFHVFEHDLIDLPGINFNCGDEQNEVWLSIDRLQKTVAPTPTDSKLIPWIKVSADPNKEPELKPFTEVDIQKSRDGKAQLNHCSDPPDRGLILSTDYEDQEEVKSKLKVYLASQWATWANKEKKRRRTIQIYEKLFSMREELKEALQDNPLELLWGIGISVWNMNGQKVCYPLITQGVEICLDDATMSLQIRPREIEESLELDLYRSSDNPGTDSLEKSYKEFIKDRTQALSPFDPTSYEPILHTGAKYLDPNGIFWPKDASEDDRKIPKVSNELKITNTWTVLARPRGQAPLVQDLENFKIQINENTSVELPPAVSSILKDPLDHEETVVLPEFRGISKICPENPAGECGQKAADLYFPLPFNFEQARIVQLLEAYNGVVVQGPPGTGKTHTIANIISHYLALGKRVLVTSMKEPALAVLRDKLPVDIRSLAISLLTNEQEGKKQFEAAIGKIASELQNINRTSLKCETESLEKTINSLHGRLVIIERKIAEWGRQNLTAISIDGSTVSPVDAAKEVVEGRDRYEWIEDELSLDCIPKFDTSDLAKLRSARELVGDNICYINIKLPEINELPTIADVVQLHKNLSRMSIYKQLILEDNLPDLSTLGVESDNHVSNLHESISKYIGLKQNVTDSGYKWLESARNILKLNAISLKPLLEVFDSIGFELKEVDNNRLTFIKRPVSALPGIETDDDILKAIENLTENRKAFGLLDRLRKSTARKKLESVRLLGQAPESKDDWCYVQFYLKQRKHSRALLIRYNSIVGEIGLESFDDTNPTNAFKAYKSFIIHKKLQEQLALEKEITSYSKKLLPSWEEHSNLFKEENTLSALQEILKKHLEYLELSTTRSLQDNLERILSSYKGPIIEELNETYSKYIGNPEFHESDITKRFSHFLKTLKSLHELRTSFLNIKEICDLIKASGAIKWAAKLETEPVNGIEHLLPDNWQEAWRLRKLATYLEQADSLEEMKDLSRQRKEAEGFLANSYQEIVAKRTWLKLSESATPSTRSALEAFRTAIAKIGKGRGKRSIRYRKDARRAASRANDVIPCWIMPHWRVSESLPSSFGSFDLVVIDEASQSDFSALPALMRAQKILVVGDHKQVSPDGVGLEEEKIRNLMRRYLRNQVPDFRDQMTPERSIYDLFRVAYPQSSIMLKEHFRCAGPIIEYSKREFYNHELKPIRLLTASERLDPPLIDILVEDGCRLQNSKVNDAEMHVIVNEISEICKNPNFDHRSIGVVSLLGSKQAMKIWDMLEQELGLEVIKKHNIACGDARTFQGKERDIIFISMVVSPGPGNARAQTQETVAQRFNVAASRARDRMYLVRSVEMEDLSLKDTLRRKLIAHFQHPFEQNEKLAKDLREKCESPFECEIYDILSERGYRVVPQVRVGGYRIDFVVEGHNDALLAIECDGDKYHLPERWEQDINRQRVLERAGWFFWRSFASDFIRNRKKVITRLIDTLEERGITPIGNNNSPVSFHTMHRSQIAFKEREIPDASGDISDT